MDDTPADIGVPPAGRAQALTESHPAEEIEGSENCRIKADSHRAVEWVFTAKN